MTITIQKWGNRQGVQIPKKILDTVKWTEGEQIIIIVDNGKLIMEKAKDKRKNIKELFADYQGNYEPIDVDWGNSEGNEI